MPSEMKTKTKWPRQNTTQNALVLSSTIIRPAMLEPANNWFEEEWHNNV